MRRVLFALPVLAVLTTVTACGGGGGDAKDAYLVAATNVCEVAKTDTAALKSSASAADLKQFVDNSLAIAKRAQSELQQLTPPPDDVAELKTKVLDPFATLITQGEAYAAKVTAAGTDQAKLLPLLAEQPKPDGIDLDFLRSYGLPTCADVIKG